jgi:chaperonin GroES
MKIRPLNDWVVLREAEAEERTAGGIIIPEVAKERPQWGTVVAVGPGAYKTEKQKGKEKAEKKFIPTVVKTGEKVLFEKYMAKEFETAGGKITMVREEYILGILDSEQGNKTALEKRGTTGLQEKKPSALQKKGPAAVEKRGKKEITKGGSKK